MKEGYIHFYTGETDFDAEYYGQEYKEPWLSRTSIIDRSDYNKKGLGTYLTLNITTAGKVIVKATDASLTRTMEYSKNGGPWETFTTSTGGRQINVVAGDNVRFRGTNATYAGVDGERVYPDPTTPNDVDYGSIKYTTFQGTTAKFTLSGNIMSIIDKDNFRTLTSLSEILTFYRLFYNCTGLTDASELVLPARTLANECYSHMFMGCSSLTKVPELPAMRLKQYCYDGMFENIGAVDATEIILPAVVAEQGCYQGMFCHNPRLTTLPVIKLRKLAAKCLHYMFAGSGLVSVPADYLPWMNLAMGCYSRMFERSTSLIGAPDLPALVAPVRSYDQMFLGCSSLVIPPKIMATEVGDYTMSQMFMGCKALTGCTLYAENLKDYTYGQMFTGATSLSYVLCLADNFTENNSSVSQWMASVPAQNTRLFVKRPGMTKWQRNSTGIPVNWRVEDATTLGKERIIIDDYDASSGSVIISSHLPWTATTDCDWISFSQASGDTGITQLEFDVAASSGKRKGNIIISTGYYDMKILVEQDRNYTDPLTFDVLSAGDIVINTNNSSVNTTIEYSKNNGEWTAITTSVQGVSIPVVSGDTVSFRGDNGWYSTCRNGNLVNYTTFSGTTCLFNARGNIFSLASSTDFADFIEGEVPSGFQIAGLFRNCANLADVTELTISTKTERYSMYHSLFENDRFVLPPNYTQGTKCEGDACHAMFQGCKSLVLPPELPCTTFTSSRVYSQMFNGCESLIKCPNLPATSLQTWCYNSMFEGCVNITEAPELPAKTLLNNCYRYMFYGCSKLSKIRCLAESGWTASACLDNWVSGVSATGIFEESPNAIINWKTNSVSGIPVGWRRDYGGELFEPFTFEVLTGGTIVYSLYESGATPKSIEYSKNGGEWTSITPTYEGVSIEVEAGDKVQFRGDNDAYATDANNKVNTFNKSTAIFNLRGNIMSLVDSTGFTTATALTADYTFCLMFIHCYGVKNIDKLCLPARTLTNQCYRGMFYDCSGLTSANMVIPADTMGTGSCRAMFYQCTSLTTIPKIVGATTIANTACRNMFAECTSLVNASGVFGGDTSTFDASGCSYMFSSCTSLETAPSLNSITGVGSYACYAMFKDCVSLVNIPSVLRTTNLYSDCYRSMFNGCSSITTAPEICGTTMTSGRPRAYYAMFANCTSLRKAPSILLPTTLRSNCYYGMFSGCTSLEVAPILPAKTSTTACYAYMFKGCSNLKYIDCQLTTISATGDTTQWVSGVSASGKFVKDPAMPVGDGGWRHPSVHGIPSGWEICGSNTVANVKSIITSGSTGSVTITSDEPWTATTSDSWISLSQTTGDTGETNVTVTFTGTLTEGTRSGSIKFGYGDKVRVHQYVLPEDYTAVTCISSTASGGQWIDLGLKMFEFSPVTFEAEGRAVIIGKGKDNNTYTTLINAKREASPYPGFAFRLHSNTTDVEWADVPSTRVFGTTGDTIDFNIKSPEPTTVESAITTTHNVSTTLFCSRDGSGTAYRFAEGSIYWLRLVSYETDMLLLPLIDANNVPGLYDVISGTFFTSLSDTPFTYTA